MLIFRNRIGFIIIAIIFWISFFGSTGVKFVFAKSKAVAANQIRAIAVKGNKLISKRTILNEVKTKPGDEYIPGTLEEDLRHIYSLGYFADITLDVGKEPTGVTVTFVIKENPQLVDIVFVGNKTFRAKRLKEEIGFKRNKVLQSGTLDLYADKLKSYYEQKEFSVDVKGVYEPISTDSGRLHYTITEHKKDKIGKIVIQGNSRLKTKQIRKVLKSKKSWFIINHYYDQSDIQEDSSRIEDLYKEHGFLKAKVTVPEPEPLPKNKGVVLRFLVEEGAPYQWDRIELTGNTLYSTAELARFIQSSTGKTFRQSQLERDIVRLFEPYANQGYVSSQIRPQLTTNDTTHTVSVLYLIRESPRIYLGNILVQGVILNEDKTIKEIPLKTKKKVIVREATLKPGDIISRKEVIKTQQKLYNLGYFDQVGINPEETLAEDTMDLLISLIEKKTANITFGGGYSSEKKAELFLDFAEPNLFGTGRLLNLRTEIAQGGTDYSLTYREPFFLDTLLTAELSIFRESLDRSLTSTQFSYDSEGNRVYGSSSTHDYQERQTGESIFFSYPITSNARLTAKLKHVQVTLDPEEDSYHIPAAVGPTNSMTNSITPGFVYENRDNYFWPTRGNRYVANIEFAGGPFGGDNDYIKYYAESSWYKTLGLQFVSALRLRGGYIQPFKNSEDAPLPDRFFLGGPNSMRGYDFRGISPHLIYIDEAQQEQTDISIGGDVMLNLNLELRRPIFERLYGLVFLDAGGVWRKAQDIDFSTVRFGVGPGILLNLPIGYLQFGFGFPLHKQPEDDLQKFYFTFGTTF